VIILAVLSALSIQTVCTFENVTIRLSLYVCLGVVSTLAGTYETCGSVDATGTNAHLGLMNGVTVHNNTIYVADSTGIRKVTTAGKCTLPGVSFGR
jgi:hypothetical protein